MKKINREKSLRIGIATLVLPIVLGIYGCHTRQNKTINKEQKQRIIEYNANMNRLCALLDIYDEINNNDISNDFRKTSGITYKNYPANDIKENEEYHTIEEIRDMLASFDKLPKNGKLELIAYINKTVNKYNLDSTFEGLYCEILSMACGIDYNDLQRNKEISYLEEGRAMIELSDEDSVELLMNYYGIGADEASWLARLIEIKPNLDDLYKIMKKNPKSEFGTEDFISERLRELYRAYDGFYNVQFKFREKYDSNYFEYNNKKKTKTK